VVVSRSGEGPPRPVPGPQYAGETRAAGPNSPGHEPLSIVHLHPHGDGHGGVHEHLHSHSNDNRHSGDGHKHTPGHPGVGTDVQLNSQDPGGEISGIPLSEQIRRFVEATGGNMSRLLEEAQTAREMREVRARERMQAAGNIAIHLRKAKRALRFEQDGFTRGAPGFTIAKIAEAQQRVDGLDAQLREVCLGDTEIIREAKRRAAR
jgi:hypothetical protein